MKQLKLIFFVLFVVFFSTNHSAAQNGEFDRLAVEYKKVKITQDSLQSLVNQYRQQIQDDPSKQNELTNKIISIEDRLYDVNYQVNRIIARVIEIDPNAGQKLIETFKPNAVPKKQVRSLINNSFFKDILSPKDIVMIDRSGAVERIVENEIKEIDRNYKNLEEIKEQYDLARTSKGVDSLKSRADLTIGIIENLDSQIAKHWKPIYDKKIESYLIAADKIEIDRQQLEQVDEYYRIVRRIQLENANQIAPNAALFSYQRAYLLHYEMMLADNLGLTIAKDSLSKEVATLSNETLNYPSIQFEYRSFIVYSKVFNDGEYDFEGVENIPELEVPEKGFYYSVQFIALQNKVKSIDTFRKIRPLRVTRGANGMYQYVVGGFRKYAEAQAAISQIAKFGYRGAVVMVAWVDGVSTTPLKAKAAQEAYEKANVGQFKIEVKTKNASLVTDLRSIVDKYSQDKQITRTQRDGELIFTIFEFDTKSEAEELADALRTKDKTTVEIIKIEEK